MDVDLFTTVAYGDVEEPTALADTEMCTELVLIPSNYTLEQLLEFIASTKHATVSQFVSVLRKHSDHLCSVFLEYVPLLRYRANAWFSLDANKLVEPDWEKLLGFKVVNQTAKDCIAHIVSIGVYTNSLDITTVGNTAYVITNGACINKEQFDLTKPCKRFYVMENSVLKCYEFAFENGCFTLEAVGNKPGRGINGTKATAFMAAYIEQYVMGHEFDYVFIPTDFSDKVRYFKDIRNQPTRLAEDRNVIRTIGNHGNSYYEGSKRIRSLELAQDMVSCAASTMFSIKREMVYVYDITQAEELDKLAL